MGPLASHAPAAHLSERSLALLLLTGVGAATCLRATLGAPAPAASLPAAACFALLLALLCAATGWRTGRVRPAHLLAGVTGAGVLVAAWWVGRSALPLRIATGTGGLAAWSLLVVAVAVAEEAVLRGALFDALTRWRGEVVAVAATSLAFGLIHVPLYGVAALPLDVAAGLWLGGLRLLAGSWAAPAVAHALADLAGGWLT